MKRERKQKAVKVEDLAPKQNPKGGVGDVNGVQVNTVRLDGSITANTYTGTNVIIKTSN